MKPAAQEAFRWSAHTGGQSLVKERDYEPAGEIDASSEYAAWKLLNGRGEPLHPGDLLEYFSENSLQSSLKIAKYIGFEPAIWWIPLPKPQMREDLPEKSDPETAKIVQTH